MAIIIGSPSDDMLFGTASGDELRGQDGNDVLDGGAGPDLLVGGSGNDTYVYRPGGGADVIDETDGGGFDTLYLSSVLPSTVLLSSIGSDLIVRFAGNPDQITITGFFNGLSPATSPAIEQFTFSDGTVWNIEAILNRLLSGNSNAAGEGGDTIAGSAAGETIFGLGGNDTISGDTGNDWLYGGSGNDWLFGNGGDDQLFGEDGDDVLRGSGGNDSLYGGTGNDLYTFGPGFGTDQIIEGGGFDSIYLGAPNDPTATPIDPQTLRLFRSANDLVLNMNGGTIYVRNHFDAANPDAAIEQILFADGTIWNAEAIARRFATANANVLDDGDNVLIGTPGSEHLYGSLGNDTISGGGGNDTIVGGMGDDRLFGNQGDDTVVGGDGNDSLWGNAGRDILDGGAGDDTYYFNLGDGHDVILDSATPTEGNRLVFGAGIAFKDLTFRQDAGDLVIDVAGTSDSVRLVNSAPPGAAGPRAVDMLQFSDGSTVSLSAVAVPVEGSDYDDWLTGSEGNDVIRGHGGNDHLQGLAGDDTLVGGTGNDQLDGGAGNDTYVFAAGDDFDVIWEGSGLPAPEAGGTDTVRLTTGYDPATTLLERWGNDLIIRNGQTGDQIVVQEHFGSADGSTRAAIERITFADGTTWNAEAIGNRLASANSNWTTENGDTVGGTSWSDYLNGMGGNDTLSGGLGDDTLDGGAGNDRLFGGDGNDLLLGWEGDDLLAGGRGDDLLRGGTGNDTYLFNSGDGVDSIDDMPMAPGERNRVVFGDGIRFADLHAYPDYWTGGLTIDVGTAGDRLQLVGSAPDPYGPHAVGLFEFADGTVATYDAVAGYGSYQQGGAFDDFLYGTGYADSLYGNDGNDQLYGNSGNDILVGGQGDDILVGGQGDDTYYFNRGDGEDFIDDIAFSPEEGNRVVFGAGIAADDVLLRTDGWTAWLEIAPAGGAPAGAPDILRFSALFPVDPQAPRSVATFEFADGTTLTADELIARGFYIGGTEYQDFLYGTDAADRIYGYGGNDQIQGAEGNDTLIGGSGNDVLVGGVGSDTYVFHRGDGIDIIVDTAYPDEANRVVFGEGISLHDLHLITPNGDVYIEIGSAADALIFAGYSPLDAAGPQPVESFVFADGSSIRYADLIARGYYIGGTEGNDTLYGDTYPNATNNVMYGYGGDDSLSGYDGNDTLVGGTGNDLLYGGAGNDTYLFNLGDGADTILDVALPGDGNRVVFGAGIRPDDLSLRLYGTTLHVYIGWYGDELIFSDFDKTDPDGLHAVDNFEFADGTSLSFAQLIAGRYIEILGTASNDVIEGTFANDLVFAGPGNDIVYGHGGDDVLWGDYTGQAGDDILDGGDGNDYLAGAGGNNILIGGRGNDTFQVESAGTVVIEYAGEGIDTVLTTLDYTLTDHVENLQLAGYVVRGTGNGLDNDIYGNSAANVLDGGAGADRMYGYGGDDTYIVDNPLDQVIEYGGQGIDTVRSSVSYALAANVENLVLTGTAAINGNGNALANVLTGNDADNMLFGGAGADTLQGRGGNDNLLGGLGGDTYLYGLGDGNDTIYELESASGDIDRVVFGNGITLPGLTVSRTGANRYDLQIGFAGSADTLTVANWFNPAVPGQVEQFQFADGTLLSGQQMADLANSAPVVAQPLADRSVLEDSASSFTLPADAFADIDNDVLSFAATLADGTALPAWLSFDAATRTFSGTPGNPEVGSLDIVVTATDRLGASASDTFTLTVQNVNDAPVVTNPIPGQGGAEGRAFSYQIPAATFTDIDAGDVLTISASLQGGGELPSWLSFDPATRTFTGTPGTSDSGTYVIDVSATDQSFEAVITSFQINIADTIVVGTASADVLYGSAGDEELLGLAGDDTLYGQAGSDTLVGGTGNDLLYGGVGDDVYVFNAGDGQDVIDDVDTAVGNVDTVRLGTGIEASSIGLAGLNGNLIIGLGGGDQITVRNWFSPLSYWTYGYPETANRIERLEFADGTVIDLTTRTDIVHSIIGGAGNESIQGGIEDNIIEAGAGNDTVNASAGNDLVYGGDGDDILYGEAGNDTLYGGNGRDELWGGDGDDVLAGGTGIVDVLYGGGGSDTYLFNLGDGQDIIVDYPNNAGDVDTLRFGAGITRAMLDISHSTANPGNIYIDLPGNDGINLYGWYYSPTYRIERIEFADGTSMTAGEIEAWADNVAPIVAEPVGTQTAMEDAEFAFQLPATTFSDANVGDVLSYAATLADGSALPAWLQFDAATRTFSGTPANEQVGTLALRVTATDSHGKSASTVFDLVVQNTNDVPVVAAPIADQAGAEGQAFSYTIPADAFRDVDLGDHLAYSATLADGSALPAWLSFDAATRTFSGNPADGTAGSYSLRVTAMDQSGASVSDDFVLTIADTIATVQNGNSSANTLHGTAFMDILNGQGGNDTLYGYDGNDLLDGGAGSDRMYGGRGDDTYIVNSTGDVVVENEDEGVDTVRSSITYTLGSNVENLILTGSSSIKGTGNSLDNLLVGNDASNTLTGNAGNDILQGLGGNDTLRGGTGDDTYVLGRGDGQDVIQENDATTGNRDTASLGVNVLDVVFARNGSNLVMSLHGGADSLTVQSWYSGTQYQTEVIQTADGSVLLNTQVDQLIQAMAQFSAASGLTWDQAIDQRPDDVQAILAAYWQPAA